MIAQINSSKIVKGFIIAVAIMIFAMSVTIVLKTSRPRTYPKFQTEKIK